MPSIARYMTCQPWTTARSAKLADARELMRVHQIRHLPVLEEGKLVGIISHRDVLLFERIAADGTVEDAMMDDVFAAGCEDPLDAVVETMAEHKYGSVVVMDRHGAVEGIFTTVDAMQVLADILHRAVA